MDSAFNDNPIYTVMALVGTLLYVIKIIMLMVSGDGSMDSGDLDDSSHVDGGESFSLVSVQSILAFFMGCGWMGLATLREWNLDEVPALAISAAFGFVLMTLSAFLTFKIKSLNSESRVDMKQAKGKTGRAYTHIPAKGEGVGQVEITVGGKQQILQAMSTSDKIVAFSAVKVDDVDDSGNLIVTQI